MQSPDKYTGPQLVSPDKNTVVSSESPNVDAVTPDVDPSDPGNVGTEKYPFLMRDESGIPMRTTEYRYFLFDGLVHSINRHHNWMLFEGRTTGLSKDEFRTILSNRDARACECVLSSF